MKNLYNKSLASQPIVDTRRSLSPKPVQAKPVQVTYKAQRAQEVAERKARKLAEPKVQKATRKTSTRRVATKKTAEPKVQKTVAKATKTTRKAQPTVDYELLASRTIATAMKHGIKCTITFGDLTVNLH